MSYVKFQLPCRSTLLGRVCDWWVRHWATGSGSWLSKTVSTAPGGHGSDITVTTSVAVLWILSPNLWIFSIRQWPSVDFLFLGQSVDLFCGFLTHLWIWRGFPFSVDVHVVDRFFFLWIYMLLCVDCCFLLATSTARCKFCRIVIKAHVKSLVVHQQSAKHQANAKSMGTTINIYN